MESDLLPNGAVVRNLGINMSTPPLPQSSRSPSGSSRSREALIPRRALRKGTRSCIECKRRKIRCYFTSSRETTCVGCKRRGTPCLGQEFFDEDGSRDRDDNDVPERLAKVEDLLSRLMEMISQQKTDTDASALRAISSTTGTTYASSSASSAALSTSNEAITSVRYRGSTRELSSGNPLESEDVSRTLYQALPSQHDADILFTTGRISAYLRVVCNPYEDVLNNREWLTETDSVSLPGPNAHPILLARSHLSLAVCIQQLDPSFDSSVLDLPDPPWTAMGRYFELAANLVMSNESYLDSVEALECLMLHAIFLTNGGNLRLALIHIRRTITIAQLMGVHRPGAQSPRKLDSRTILSCPVVWGRYLWLERYLSLLLGLPTATAADNPNLRTDFLTANEKLDMAHSLIFVRVAQRNQTGDYHDFNVTHEIDYEIEQAANNLPPKWWNAPTFHPSMDAAEMMSCVVRGQTQIIHFNLLNILHLPYILRDASDAKYNYNKMACMVAAREVLGRYITFRSFIRVVWCCRPVDFCALTASLSLLLAHLDSHQNNIGEVMTQQRLEDRSLIERVLVTLDELNRVNDDELSRQTAQVARKLLIVESDVAAGANSYSARNNSGSDANIDGGQTRGSFPVKIPYFRTVTVASVETEQPQYRNDLLGALGVTSAFQGDVHAAASIVSDSISSTDSSSQPASRMGTDVPSPLALPPQEPPDQFSGQMSWQFSQNRRPDIQQGDSAAMRQSTFLDVWPERSSGDIYPGLLTDAGEWAMQGVDAAFFDAVLRNE